MINPDGTKVKNNLFSKGQRVITDKYREGYDSIKWDNDKRKDKNSK